MTQLLKILPLGAALIAAPALAAQPDAHAGHHPEAAKPSPKPDSKQATHACPMMDGRMAAGSGAMSGKASGGKMMMEGNDRHCMTAPAAPKAAEPLQDHDHSAAAPKPPEKPK